MHIKYDIISNFKLYESDTTPKVLLNICSPFYWDVTDSNLFYNRFYTKVREDFNQHQESHKMGENCYINIFSYHIICNMFCVEWPKTIINMKPFKYSYFKKCCSELKKYLIEKDIQFLISPVFGLEILEGRWDRILSIMNSILPKNIDYICIKQTK